MTTRIKIINEGPENAAIWYYDQNRIFKEHKDHLIPGQSLEIYIWDGHLPVVLPLGHVPKPLMNNSGKFFSVPPACY